MYSIEDIENLTIRSYNVLKRAGINTIEQVKSMSKNELLSLKGATNKIVEELEQKLQFEFQ